MKTIAIQGIKGSFHHQVAQQMFPALDFELLECMSFQALVKHVSSNPDSIGIMAIENSIAGSIIPNYALLDCYNLVIQQEFYLSIEMQLMALPNQNINDINEVHSHPMALLQCADFFSNFPHIKLIETNDTAESALYIQTNNILKTAAIASKTAAEMYNLTVIAPNIHSSNTNTTRFIIVANKSIKQGKKSTNKASVKFELEHKQGSLSSLLTILSTLKLNLTKIQSMPIIDSPFQYSFFVDVTYQKYKHFKKAQKVMKLMTSNFKILGNYTSQL